MRAKTILKTRFAAFAIFAEMNKAVAGPINAFVRKARSGNVRDRDTLSLRQRETGVVRKVAGQAGPDCAVKKCSDGGTPCSR